MKEVLFRRLPNAHVPKVECVICGASGFPGGRWQNACKKGHPFQCPQCGARKNSSSGLANHIRLRKDHHGPGQETLF